MDDHYSDHGAICPFCGHLDQASDSDGLLYDEGRCEWECGACGEEYDAWRDEPESSEAWCAGNQHVLDRLCVVAGANPAAVQWDGSDGSLNEETDALIWRILRHNDDDDGLSPREKALIREAEARVMRIAAGLFPGGYDANFAKIEAAIRETKP